MIYYDINIRWIWYFNVTYLIKYATLYLYLICEMNKKNLKCILFSTFKIKIISHLNIFYLKNENFVIFNDIYD